MIIFKKYLKDLIMLLTLISSFALFLGIATFLCVLTNSIVVFIISIILMLPILAGLCKNIEKIETFVNNKLRLN